MYKYIHTCIYIHIYMSAHIHTYTFMHTHIQNVHMKRTQARLERRRSSEHARSCCRERKLCKSLSFDAIKPHFAPQMQGLHCTHLLKHQDPSKPLPLFPTYPRTFRGPRACAAPLLHTDQMNRAHNPEEAPRTFTMAPCAVADRLEGKHRCNRVAASEHEGIQARK